MVWKSVLERDHFTVKLDEKDRTALLEVNDGGIAPAYVTVRLQEQEIDELIDALQQVRNALK
ncbi:hypothetical protein B5M42_010805 [Paenibacillus athensensis]|uniref:Uncharacterized protein n=1 Tax=Paenibacillus athensensis TaxID=1967502 RepID=A0A4Y8PZ62_9BACL|nr:hypothetical protein [Paenibacillus athensensis]MCD1259325.1 hypothetical protein [Paenibacillus athensensis]